MSRWAGCIAVSGLAAALVTCVMQGAAAQGAGPGAKPAKADALQRVDLTNFIRAESDRYMAENAGQAGGPGKLMHVREPADIDRQTVIRLNRDTLYSFGVLDLEAGPATIALPASGDRFMSLMVVSQDHHTPFVIYGDRPLTLTKANVGSRYAFIAVRTLADPNDPADLAHAHKLQDGIRIDQEKPGALEFPAWDRDSLDRLRAALLEVAKYNPDFRGAFGPKGKVDPVKHLLGTAAGWGGNPDRDAAYDSIVPDNDNGEQVYRVTVPRDAPVDAFWSVSVYNANGFFEKNPLNAYSVNSITGRKNPDGSVTIQFGGCDGKIANCIPTPKGWNALVRMYRPREQVLTGAWSFPKPEPVKQP